MKNLREVLERVLGRVHETLKQRQRATGLPVRPRAKRRRSKNEQMASHMARLRREARSAEVIALYRQGVSIVGIAEDLHMSRTTVRKFVAAGAFPERADTLREPGAFSIRIFRICSNAWSKALPMPASCGETCVSKASRAATK
jgi:BRCT domain type II-containing protein